ncbi:MAG: right-handed parallel beta-helix repeat-containing protein [Candidatus Electrothrix sp. AX2]|nr:right-handed parallel beta-helix repeat-containing protein [Candidatus Electrothrix gigas]
MSEPNSTCLYELCESGRPNGRLYLECCDISGTGFACVTLHCDATPRLHRNIISGGYFGIVAYNNGQGTLESNEIFANRASGVEIKGGSSLTLRCNRISQNGNVAISVHSGGSGIFEDNDLRGNTEGAWYIDPDCEANVQRRGNKE